MQIRFLAGTALACLALAAQAQTPAPAAASGVQESTDPAKAAAVERAAAELKRKPPPAPVVIVRTSTADGYALMSGGITREDRVAMHAERQRYSLWVATVGKPSGAYLADVDLRITRLPAKTVVLERKMEGPWLLLALPAGSYDVSGSYREAGAEKPQTLSARVQIAAKGQRQAVLRFDSKATVDSDAQSPFQGNPFGSPRAK